MNSSKISKINLIGSLVTLIFFSVVVLYLFVYTEYKTFDVKSQNFQTTYIENQKLFIKQEITRMVTDINHHIEELKSSKFFANKDELKLHLLNIIDTTRFGVGEYGYYWVHDSNYTMILHPIVRDLIGRDVKDFISKDKKLIFQEMNSIVKNGEGGFLTYVWNNPKTGIEEQKISYVKYIKELDWIIGTGFYLSDLDYLLKQEREILTKIVDENLKLAVIIISIVALFNLFIIFYVNRYIYGLEKIDSHHMNMLEEYKRVLDSSSIVSKSDLKGNITYINDAFCRVSGYSKDELIGKPHNILRHPATPKETFKDMWLTIKAGDIWQGILKNRTKHDGSFFVKVTIVPIKDESGNIVEYIAARNDVTELFEQKEHIKKIFNTDSLTSLGNRFKLLNDISIFTPKAVAMIDIDRFREINNIYGYKVGDFIIVELANRIFELTYKDDFSIYRLESDRYTIVSNTKELDTEKFIFKIKQIVQEVTSKGFLVKEKEEIPISITAGIAFEDENILVYADIALKIAKQDKKELIVFNKQNLSNLYQNNIETITLIKKALERDGVLPFFQPIYSFHSDKIEKFECLMRIIDDKDEVILPFKFLEIAKKTKLYPKLTNKIIEKSALFFKDLAYEFSINLTVEDLLNDETMDFLLYTIKENQIEKKIVLEIVESEHIDNYDEAIGILEKFKALGVRIAIDDFGSGYSNFDYLIRLKADYVKIDGSIIKQIERDESAKELVLSIVGFAKKSNMKIIAEFVSSEKIANLLKEIGVDYAQGFYYGKPERNF